MSTKKSEPKTAYSRRYERYRSRVRWWRENEPFYRNIPTSIMVMLVQLDDLVATLAEKVEGLDPNDKAWRSLSDLMAKRQALLEFIDRPTEGEEE